MREYIYKVHVYFSHENGTDHTKLGECFVKAMSMKDARERAIDELWDERLASASCAPYAIASRASKEDYNGHI